MHSLAVWFRDLILPLLFVCSKCSVLRLSPDDVVCAVAQLTMRLILSDLKRAVSLAPVFALNLVH
jgi:hypothetical protein